MAQGVNGSRALMLLGEMRSDLKWLVQKAEATEAHILHHGERLTKLETRKASEPIAWGPLLRIALGVAPLTAAAAHAITWHQALDVFDKLIGLVGP